MLQKYDSRNDDLQVYVNGELVPRAEARISVFDSVVQGGDAVWEGIRVYKGRIFALDRHLRRLEDSAHAIDFRNIPSREEVRTALLQTLQANGMTDETHVRLTLTRGEKITSGMDPRLNTMGCGLIVLAEWKPPVYPESIRLVTAAIRRNSPVHLDSKIHHNNLLNNILAKIEANLAGVDDALMLDARGFLSETNATNVFLARDGVLYTPYAHACLPGITRGLVLEIAEEIGIDAREKDISLTEMYTADEAFTTGTMGELTRVAEVDGRAIRDRANAGVLERIQARFRERTASEGFEL
jgi:branched-chain amino acid aminotransferase group I